MITGWRCQASRHKSRGNSTVGDTEHKACRQLPECQLTGQTQCNKGDDLHQHVQNIACHETWQTLFLSHLGIDQNSMYVRPPVKIETSPTLFLVDFGLKHAQR